MTVVFYTCFTSFLSQERLEYLASSLPVHMREKIRSFRRIQDAQASLFGKLLLREALPYFNVGLSLQDISHTLHWKPFLRDSAVSFNISHSGQYVVCAISDEVDSLGIDVEQIAERNLDDFGSVFSSGEWDSILTDPTKKKFYEYWTRKESVIKAEGSGMFLTLNEIDVRDCRVEVNNRMYFMKPLNLHPGYAVHLASVKNFSHVDLIACSFS